MLGRVALVSMKRRIKVQIGAAMSAKSFITSGASSDPLTFICYSEEMKARVLDLLLSDADVRVSFTDEKRDGEWHEPFVDGAKRLV